MRAWAPGRTSGLASKTIVLALCCGLTMAGCKTTEAEAPPVLEVQPTASAQATAPTASEEPSAADLWSDDQSRIDTPLLDHVDLEPETQWAIFDECGQDVSLFCATMAIAYNESRFTPDLLGDDGKSIGMMQINTRWHTGRMEALGVTDLTDPVQSARVAIDYLKELEEITGATTDDPALYMAYNMGPSGARKAQESGTTSTAYSDAVLTTYRSYKEQMEWADDGE